jgi:thiol-disulfide isomerase/thioredoxin
MSQQKRPALVLAAAAAAAAAAAFFAKDALLPPVAETPKADATSAVRPKRAAPAGPLLVLSRDGARRDLASRNGKGQILHFWATWCAPCREEMPELAKFVKDTKDDSRVEFLAVSVDEDWKTADSWLSRAGISGLPLALDPRGPVAGRFGATGYPETFFVTPTGEVVQHFVGAAQWSSPELRAFAAEFSRASASAAASTAPSTAAAR